MEQLRRKVGFSLFLFLCLVIIGMLGYHYLEGWPILDSFYMTIITLGTVGFSEVHGLDNTGKIFTSILIILGLSVVTYFFTLVSKIILEGELKEHFGRKKVEKKIETITNHTIICGYGRIGEIVAKEYRKQEQPCVVIEKDEDKFKRLEEEDFLAILGDSTEDEILIKAGVKRAKCLISVASTDAQNLYITMSARQLNPEIYILTRVEEHNAENKMIRAGANKVISPYKIGANQIAQASLRPTVIDFIEIATQTSNLEFTIEEIRVPEKSPLANKSLKELGLSRSIGIIIIGIKRLDKMLFNPSADMEIYQNDILIAMGNPEQLKKFTAMVEQA